jgi:hypothetical protein
MIFNEASIISRLDPRFIHSYVCEEERNSEDKTIFRFKNLSVSEFRECEDIYLAHSNLGQSGLKVLEFGLVGWDNFTFDKGEVIPFDFEHISSIPYENQLELSERIFSLAQVEQDIEDEIILILKWSEWLDKAKNKEQWQCEYCITKKLDLARNCSGKHTYKCKDCNAYYETNECSKCKKTLKPNLIFRFSTKLDDFVTRCPVSLITIRAIKIVNLVNYCDNSKSLPFSGGALEQTHFFYSMRNVVLSTQNMLIKKEYDSMREKTKQAGK